MIYVLTKWICINNWEGQSSIQILYFNLPHRMNLPSRAQVVREQIKRKNWQRNNNRNNIHLSWIINWIYRKEAGERWMLHINLKIYCQQSKWQSKKGLEQTMENHKDVPGQYQHSPVFESQLLELPGRKNQKLYKSFELKESVRIIFLNSVRLTPI